MRRQTPHTELRHSHVLPPVGSGHASRSLSRVHGGHLYISAPGLTIGVRVVHYHAQVPRKGLHDRLSHTNIKAWVNDTKAAHLLGGFQALLRGLQRVSVDPDVDPDVRNTHARPSQSVCRSLSGAPLACFLTAYTAMICEYYSWTCYSPAVIRQYLVVPHTPSAHYTMWRERRKASERGVQAALRDKRVSINTLSTHATCLLSVHIIIHIYTTF